MTNPQITTDLGRVLGQINQKLDKIDERLNKLEVGQARIEESLNGVKVELGSVKDDIKDLKGFYRNQIWMLIGILGTAVVGIVIRFVVSPPKA